MSEIKQKSVEVFLDELASKQATPGGGSAAAVMGAQSAALTSMVCNLTIGKPKYAEVEQDMKALLIQSEKLREQLTAMIKADVDVFDKLMASYGLPKDTDEEKSTRSAQIQAILKEATLVPLECAKACDGYFAVVFDTRNDGFDDRVHGFAGVAFGAFEFGCHFIDEVALVHNARLRLRCESPL